MKEKEKLVRDTLSVLLSEVRELEKMIERDADSKQVTDLVDKSMTQVGDLVDIHMRTWTTEVREEILREFLKGEMQTAISKSAIVFCQIHAMTGVKISTIAESAFKEAQQLCKEDSE